MAGKTAPAFRNRWTNTNGEMRAYVRSKVIAERAAWDFMAAEGGRLELAATAESLIRFGIVADGRR